MYHSAALTVTELLLYLLSTRPSQDGGYKMSATGTLPLETPFKCELVSQKKSPRQLRCRAVSRWWLPVCADDDDEYVAHKRAEQKRKR